MLDALGKLPKTIDAFVAGVIELAYLYGAAIGYTLARPIGGPRALIADEDRLSSRTVLFASSATLASVRFVGAHQLNLVSGSDGAGALLLRVVAFYVVFDLLSALAARAVLPPGRQAVRSMMRYSLGAALALLALASLALQVTATLLPSVATRLQGDWPDLAVTTTLAALLLLFYAPAATFARLAAQAGGGRMTGWTAALAAAAGAALSVAALGVIGSFAPVIQMVLGGRWETSSETCELRGGKVRVVAAIFNGRGETLAISRDSFVIELAPILPGDRTMRDALNAHPIRVLIDRIDGDLLVVKPGETGILRAEADLLRKELAMVANRKPGSACRLSANKLPTMLLITSGRRLDHAIGAVPVTTYDASPYEGLDDGTRNVKGLPPVYHPGQATAAKLH